MTTQSRTSQAGINRSLLLIGLGVLALVIVTSLAVVLVGRGEAREYPANSPEGALQRYLAAFDEGDYEVAYGFFSEEVQADTSLDEYERMASGYGPFFGDGVTRRVVFERVDGEADRVRVHLTVEDFYGGGFGGGDTIRTPYQITMVRENGEWRIDRLLLWLDPASFPGSHVK